MAERARDRAVEAFAAFVDRTVVNGEPHIDMDEIEAIVDLVIDAAVRETLRRIHRTDLRCPCGGVILADTEDWKTPLCDDCVDPSDIE